MNNTAKILMLLAAIAAAVFAVGYYAKRITAPPMQTSFPNVHLASLRTDLARLDQQPTMEVADSVFNVTLHAARYFQREGLVSVKESDDVIVKLTHKYTPLFLADANAHFSSQTWASGKNFELRRRAKLLNGLRMQEDKRQILEGEDRANVDSVYNTIVDYDAANQLADKTYFSSLDDARERINQARAYARQANLRGCTTLIDRLNALPGAIEAKHYEHVKGMVETLAEYTTIDENYYMNTLNKQAMAAIDEYKKYAYQVYGRNSDMGRLNDLAGEYYNEAQGYYQAKRSREYFNY